MKKKILYIFIGIVLGTAITVSASIIINANQVSYNNKTVDEALNDLYSKADDIDLLTLIKKKGIKKASAPTVNDYGSFSSVVGKKYLLIIERQAYQSYSVSLPTGCTLIEDIVSSNGISWSNGWNPASRISVVEATSTTIKTAATGTQLYYIELD